MLKCEKVVHFNESGSGLKGNYAFSNKCLCNLWHKFMKIGDIELPMESSIIDFLISSVIQSRAIDKLWFLEGRLGSRVFFS